jgi:CzcA family heavy metal efflux pump
MSITALVQRHRAMILVATAFLTISGPYLFATLGAGIYPEVTYPRIVVIAQGTAFEAEAMTVAATRPIEEAMAGMIGLVKIRSRTVRGAAEISLDFQPRMDMWHALQQVDGRLATVRPSLPPQVELTAQRLTPSVFPVVQYELTGADPLTLFDIAQFRIRPLLIRAPDVGEVEVQGGDQREVTVALDPTRLVATHISATDVVSAIAASDVAGAAGRVTRHYEQFSVVASGLTATPPAVGAIVVRQAGDRPIRVADLGSVAYGRSDVFQLIRGDGTPAALINVARQPGGDILRLQASVRAILDSVRPSLPTGVRLASVYDQGSLVRESLATVRDAILVGGILAILVLLAFLGDLRLTLAASIILPLSLIGAFAGIALTGGSLNLMSLGGLAVAIGLVIDNAVVVVENVERRMTMHPGEPLHDVIRRGTDEIFGPVLSSTVTTIVVFFPLGLVQGVVGQFFQAFSIALAIAVALSLLLAIGLIPVLAEWWLGGRDSHASPRRWPRLRLEPIERVYRWTLEYLLDRRRLAWGLAGLLAVTAYGFSRIVGSGFLPEMDEGGFILDYWAPTASSMDETDRQVNLIETIIRRDPDVQAFSRRTGTELGFAATSPNRGDLTVLLKARSRRSSSVYEVMDRVRDQIERAVPAVRVEFMQLMQDVIGDLAGAPSPIEIKLFTPDQALGEATGKRVASAIAEVPGLVDVFDGTPGDNVETRVNVDPVRAARLGLTTADVLAQAQASLFGTDAGSIREADRMVPIHVRLPDEARYGPDIAQTLPIVGPQAWTPLGMLGTVRDTAVASELLREDLRPVVKVTGRVAGSNLGAVMQRIRRAVDTLALPAGVTIEYGGQYASQQESFGQLLLVLFLAVAGVLVVLVLQFRTLRAPAALIVATPLGLTGAVVGLALTGIPFNVSSFMGLILLVGLMVRNGILLIDAAHAGRRGGLPAREALIAAGAVRMRPILMTTLCTVAGLFPLALGWGAGADLQRPLAVAVIGGLTLSTAITLILLPIGLDAVGALDEGGS